MRGFADCHILLIKIRLNQMTTPTIRSNSRTAVSKPVGIEPSNPSSEKTTRKTDRMNKTAKALPVRIVMHPHLVT